MLRTIGTLAVIVMLAGCQSAPSGTVDTDGRHDHGKIVGHVIRASPDLLVVGARQLHKRIGERVRRLPGVRSAMSLSVGEFAIGGEPITVGAVDVASYRRFTAPRTATSDHAWEAIADGDLAVTGRAAAELDLPVGTTLSFTESGTRLNVAAHAAAVPAVDALVNLSQGKRLGVPPGNALLISLKDSNIRETVAALGRVLPQDARIDHLTDRVPSLGTDRARHQVSGTADLLGTFSYRSFPDGTVQPDHEWVVANIRTEVVPLLGAVTCHRVMLPQLRAALTEIVRNGLSHTIRPDQYGGCYVPRFIGNDPSKGLSLHTWGIAVDLNVGGNHRGTLGQIDRQVVDIFKKWGFAWGGDWEWTDPMHFELDRVMPQ